MDAIDIALAVIGALLVAVFIYNYRRLTRGS